MKAWTGEKTHVQNWDTKLEAMANTTSTLRTECSGPQDCLSLPLGYPQTCQPVGRGRICLYTAPVPADTFCIETADCMSGLFCDDGQGACRQFRPDNVSLTIVSAVVACITLIIVIAVTCAGCNRLHRASVRSNRVSVDSVKSQLPAYTPWEMEERSPARDGELQRRAPGPGVSIVIPSVRRSPAMPSSTPSLPGYDGALLSPAPTYMS